MSINNVEELPKDFNLKIKTLRTCIPSNSIDLSSPLSNSFERCSYFIIMDFNSQKTTAFLNDFQTAPRGVDIQTAQMMTDQQVEAVIVPENNSNALNMLQKAGIKTYLGIDGTIQENISLFRQNRLVEIK